MKINGLTKEIIQTVANKRAQAEYAFKQANEELINLLISTTGEQGFNGYEIKEDELILKFPIQEEIKKLRKGK